MELLHILRSEPDALVRRIVDAMSKGKDAREVPLFGGPIDYDRLVKDIFEARKVICWW
ncbi:MAG TPA: hypothetical protein VFL83_01460 [Anaeromyxobacter sp.]|nr:hypothetical protein [Anaeromyxobacter sp.]